MYRRRGPIGSYGRTVLDADAQAEGIVSEELSTFHGPWVGRVTRKRWMPLFVRVQWPICGFNECFGRALGKGGVFSIRPWVRLVVEAAMKVNEVNKSVKTYQ